MCWLFLFRQMSHFAGLSCKFIKCRFPRVFAVICLNNPTTDCDLVGTAYGKYGYCGNCGSWAVCRATKRNVKSCINLAPNLFFSRATRNCTACRDSCKGLPG